MVQSAQGTGGGADGGVTESKSTQNTQYDQIGVRYLDIKQLPAVEPELPSILAVLGEDGVRGKECLDLACGTGKYTHLLHILGATNVTGYDISSTMIASALAAYPPSQYPTLHFGVADCSIPRSFPSSISDGTMGADVFDLVFSAWFLNYAGTETELTNMFRVIESQMKEGGRFVGLTTDVHDSNMHVPKPNFYGLDILVLDPAYVAPDTGEMVGIKARVKTGGGIENYKEGGFEFDVFQFRKDVYERCAKKAGLSLEWKELEVPDDERKNSGYWNKWLRRPTFAMLEGWRVRQ